MIIQPLPLEVVKRESRLAAMSENLRVLYVAMTRAKSQFISFASVRSLESRVKTLAAYMQQGKPLPHLCSKLLYDSDFLLMSALCHPDGGALREMATVEVPVHPADFALQVVFHTPETEAPVQTVERETAADPHIVEQIREKLDYTYPYAALSKVSGKRNASALDEAVFTGAYVARSVPAFLQPDGLTPAEKGTAMHTFMQYCDYAAARRFRAGDRPGAKCRVSATGGGAHLGSAKADRFLYRPIWCPGVRRQGGLPRAESGVIPAGARPGTGGRR